MLALNAAIEATQAGSAGAGLLLLREKLETWLRIQNKPPMRFRM